MKTKIVFILLVVALFTACKRNNVYSELLKAERNLIEEYMQRQGISVVTEEPTEWKEHVYWQLPDYDNIYFHLVDQGDTTQAAIEAKEKERTGIKNLKIKPTPLVGGWAFFMQCK